MIQMVDFKKEYASIKEELDRAMQKVLDSGWFVLGREGEAFEEEFAGYLGAKYAVGVGSGTEALHLALLACGVKEGDEVITVPNTAVPTVSAIDFAGAKPVFVDIDPETYEMDPSKIEEKITPSTKAIIPVHLFGNPADVDPIIEIAEKHNLVLIEDACQAHGATYKGKKVGTFGKTGCFSFYPTKNLGTYGDGGMVVTNDKDTAEKLKALRNYGQGETRYVHNIKGFNSRLDEMHAAILRVKLKYLDQWNDQRRQLVNIYTNLLAGSKVKTPVETKGATSCYHLYTIRTEKRDALQEFLKENGVITNIHYPLPIYLQEAYKELGLTEGACPIAEKYAKQILSLPLYPLLTKEELETVVVLILEFEKK